MKPATIVNITGQHEKRKPSSRDFIHFINLRRKWRNRTTPAPERVVCSMDQLTGGGQSEAESKSDGE
ncbi:unnamed protein product [Arabis nemorensis]|uniref:Uncharacterized protein n=1 Tax=Arabis nemorensis TaxID=586526 RepID=A0A565BYB9_9BRAS|nr:unnamed protein product [Arabis nemorensis]